MKLQRKNKFLGLIGTGLLIASLATGGYVVFEEMQNKSTYEYLEQIALVKTEEKKVTAVPNTEEPAEQAAEPVTPKYDFNKLK